MDLYSGKTEICEEEFFDGFFIIGDEVYFEEAGCPVVGLPDDWNTLYDVGFGGYVEVCSYSDGEIQVFRNEYEDVYCYRLGAVYEEDSKGASLEVK